MEVGWGDVGAREGRSRVVVDECTVLWWKVGWWC